jgi:hypothetical protein
MVIINNDMKALVLIPFLTILLIGCSKSPLKSYLPPNVLVFKINNPPAGFVSVYYFDSTANKDQFVQIRSWSSNFNFNLPNGGYADSIPTGDFGSSYLFDACGNGIKNFKLKLNNGNATEIHDLFINFKHLPPPGGFYIPNASIDGKLLPALTDSLTPIDSSKYKYGYIETNFIYNH